MLRNSTNTLKVFAFNHNTAHPQTGDAANITCKVSLDGAAAVALADTNPTEMEDGYYLFNVTAAESNGVTADFFPESSTNNVQVICAEHNRYLLPQGGVATLSNQNSIISAVSGGNVQVVSPITRSGSLELYNDRYYGGSAHAAIAFTVSKDYSTASSVKLAIYSDSEEVLVELTGTVASSTLINVTGSISLTDSLFAENGTWQGKYSLWATFAGSQRETIRSAKCVVFAQPE